MRRSTKLLLAVGVAVAIEAALLGGMKGYFWSLDHYPRFSMAMVFIFVTVAIAIPLYRFNWQKVKAALSG